MTTDAIRFNTSSLRVEEQPSILRPYRITYYDHLYDRKHTETVITTSLDRASKYASEQAHKHNADHIGIREVRVL